MRFKKGTKVEVLSKAEVPSGSWLCAEIICGNGHSYTVRYNGFHGAASDAIVERVSRKAIRPCPPELELAENWNPGDVVEVFRNYSWKMATVLKDWGNKYVSVRLLGSSMEFLANKFEIRVRQSWQDDKWILVGKGSASCRKGKRDNTLIPRQSLISSSQIQKTNTKTKLSASNDYHSEKKDIGFFDSRLVSFKTLKRRSHSQVEAYAEPPPKFRAIENEDRCHRVRVSNPSTPLKKVHGVGIPRDVIIEECLPASVNKKIGMYDMDIERRKLTGAVGCSFGENTESNDADSITCSVGSCSITSRNSYKLQFRVPAGPFEDVDSPFSDAESVCQREYDEGNCSPPTQEELAAEIHRLELDAYRCTIEALHASGPLSWEQEALMTNLRLSLHISNDEHLVELKNLISSENSLPFR
ncbi:uncharacterized protein LOC107469694 isoform X1 [Arachis duranensis]|uniref:Uncharacterized protein LOC107469694 isoform X1 n=1 Tax=Arachis duranensis TaxID=130453 RepID=A0A6P4C9B9_ARADU|nr:uncharacterized protein LOC107469694 isoform X1 [Arachis duranensis]